MWHYETLLRGPPHKWLGMHSAALNFACAHGLPGTETWDLRQCWRRIEEITERVRWKTIRAARKFDRRPQDFNNSAAYFRALVLVDTLQRDCGIKYDSGKIPEDVGFGVEDTFVYGPLMRGCGTCASLPVLYATIGQRLGYPMKLVATKGQKWTHLFIRWDGQGTRFNIETTAAGFISDPDAHYRTAPYVISPEDERAGGFLRSMSPPEEMASYLASRAHCWLDHDRNRGAADALAWACALCPENQYYRQTLAGVLNRWSDALEARNPPHFPPQSVRADKRRYPPTLPEKTERDIGGLEATENMLNTPELENKLWGPLRKGMIPQKLPRLALVDLAPDGSCNIRFEFSNPFYYCLDLGGAR